MKGKNLLVNILLLTNLFWACKNSASLEDYCQELAKQSTPSEFMKEFIGDSISLPPDLYILYGYNKLDSKWKYTKESKYKDDVQKAEDIIKNNSFKGDCEDFSVLLMALCRLREIDAVFCLGKNIENKKRGHVWIEIPICAVKNYNEELNSRISKNLSSGVITTKRNDTVWLSFLELDVKKRYELEYTVDSNGTFKNMK